MRTRLKTYSRAIAPLVAALITIAIGCTAIGQSTRNAETKSAEDYKKMANVTREELVRRAVKFGDPILATLQKPETVVEQLPTPFLTDGGIYKVSTRPPDRPRVYNLGVWGTDGIELLNNEPDHFFEVAAEGGLSLRSGDDYVRYVTTYIDVTRDFTGGVQVLNSIEESWWLPSPSPEEARKREEVTAKYRSIVEAPKVSRESDRTVVVYLIRDRVLIRMHAKVDGDGRIQITEDTLEPKMPTVMLR
jgi:hypothetical protein